MEWQDEAIVLGLRSHGETSAIAELFTAKHGRHLGLVRGGRSRRSRPILQPGNLVSAVWRARLDEHLGQFTIELIEPIASHFFDDVPALAGLNTLCAELSLFAERDQHEALYNGALTLLCEMQASDIWPGLLARFELELLSELGFGLDLSACAGGGKSDDLIYVSPKSGRSVSRDVGEPYKDKLLDLPQFLRGDLSKEILPGDVLQGLKLTGFFLERDVWGPRGMSPFTARQNLISILKRQYQEG